VKDWARLVARARRVPRSYIPAFVDEPAALVGRINRRALQAVRFDDGHLHAIPINSYRPPGRARRCDVSVAWIPKEPHAEAEA
jgi:hypothetical protein